MKKGIIIFLIILFVSIACSFIFIPSTITVSGYKIVAAPSSSVSRLFERQGNIKKLWQAEKKNDTTFYFENIKYTVLKSTALGITLNASLNNFSTTGEINAILVNKDSCAVQLQYQPFETSFNPVTRITYFFKALTLKKQLVNILESFKSYAEDKKNVYGLNIIETKVKDSSLISTKKTYNHYPTNNDIDELINKLKKYIEKNGGVIHDYPMLNIHINEEKKYEAMVAIPLLKDIPAKDDIVIKKMILGNILEAKTTGGDATIEAGLTAIKNYATDYHRVSPAIPFQSIVTDRAKESDTTKWVTILKYPVF